MKRNRLLIFTITFLIVLMICSCSTNKREIKKQRTYLETYFIYPEASLIYRKTDTDEEIIVLKTNSDPLSVQTFYKAIFNQEGFELVLEKEIKNGYFLEFAGKPGKVEVNVVKTDSGSNVSILLKKNYSFR